MSKSKSEIEIESDSDSTTHTVMPSLEQAKRAIMESSRSLP